MFRIAESIRAFIGLPPSSAASSSSSNSLSAEVAARSIQESEYLRERIAELEYQMEDSEWLRLTNQTQELELSRDTIRNIARLSRILWLKNPLVRRGVEIQVLYLWARGFTIAAAHDPDTDEPNEELDKFIKLMTTTPGNQAELFGHHAAEGKERELTIEGNLFFTLFPPTAGSDSPVEVRSIPAHEIESIICNPEDRRDKWFYLRSWTLQTVSLDTGQMQSTSTRRYYPDWALAARALEGTNPTPIPDRIGDIPVDSTPVMHVAAGNLPDMLFGVSEIYSAQDWARAYTKFMSDWATITSAYARFAWRLTTQGGKAGIDQAKAKLNTTVTASAPQERNPPPLAGSTFISSDTAKLEPLRTAGATTKAEDGRRILLMVCAAFGIPETFMGDVSVGTLATGKSLDRPTELQFVNRQSMWASVFSAIIYAAMMLKNRIRYSEERPPISVTFPPILEHDTLQRVSAIVSGATLDGKTMANPATMSKETLARLVLSALDVPDIDEQMKKLVDTWKEQERERIEQLGVEREQAKANIAKTNFAAQSPNAQSTGSQSRPTAVAASSIEDSEAAHECFRRFAMAVEEFCDRYASPGSESVISGGGGGGGD